MSLTPKDPNYFEPAYVDYIVKELGNKQIVELRYRLFPGIPPIPRKDAEAFLIDQIEHSTIPLNERYFATLDPYFSMSLTNITSLEKVVGAAGRVETLSPRYIKLDSGEKWVYLPPYGLKEAPFDQEVRITMDFSLENESLEGLFAAVKAAHADLKPFSYLFSPTPGEFDYPPLPYHRSCVFLDPDMKHNIDKYPNTIGKERLPIQSLILLFPRLENWKEQVEELQNRGFSSWRKARGDGNCYYRAVGVAYLEGVMRVGRLEALFYLLNRIETQQDYFIWEGFEDHHYYFHRSLHPFLLQYQGKATIIQDFQHLLEDVAFDAALIGVFKNLAADWLHKNQGNENIYPFIIDTGVESVLRAIVEDEKEGEGVTFMAMANALQAQVTHVIANEKALKGHFEEFRPLIGETIVEVNLLLRPGHYDILYKGVEDQMDRYDSFARNYY